MRFMGWTAALVFLALGGAAFAEHGAAGPRGGRLERMDANGDGAITREEASAARAAMFARLDADNDGFISEQERAARAEERRRRRAGHIMRRFDADGDGRVSRSEFLSAPTPGFDRADADRDGVLTAQELAAARERRPRHAKE